MPLTHRTISAASLATPPSLCGDDATVGNDRGAWEPVIEFNSAVNLASGCAYNFSALGWSKPWPSPFRTPPPTARGEMEREER